MVDIPESGLYTLSVFGTAAGGQRWLADGCRTSLICPHVDEAARWRDVLSGVFPKGKHYFSATLGPETSVERLKIEQKKDTPADYPATLERLGLPLGAPGPVDARARPTRRGASLEGRRAQRQRELCGGHPASRDARRRDHFRVEHRPQVRMRRRQHRRRQHRRGRQHRGGGNVPPPIIPPLPPGSPTSVAPASGRR